ncbi:MAG: hypothetical protein IPJ31_03510 [Bacteroidetes bacterium]|nr:hypothetical protein [Bacteroidota bacterium]
MMNFFKYCCLLIILLSLTNCKKNPPSPDTVLFDLTDSCDGIFVPVPTNQFPHFIFSNNYIDWLHINPNNPSEFFYKGRDGMFNTKLYRLDRNTLTTKVLLDTITKSGNPQVNNTGHVLFYNEENYHLWTINSNGDSLTKIIRAGWNCFWNFSGDKIMCTEADSITHKGTNIVFDINNKKRDTLAFSIQYWFDWQNEDNLLLSTSNYEPPIGFRINNITNKTSFTIPYLPYITKYGVYHLCWISKTEFVYSNDGYLKVFNLSSNLHTKLLKLCKNTDIQSVSYSYKTNEVFVLLKKLENIENSDATFVSTPKIIVINLNTRLLSVINL